MWLKNESIHSLMHTQIYTYCYAIFDKFIQDSLFHPLRVYALWKDVVGKVDTFIHLHFILLQSWIINCFLEIFHRKNEWKRESESAWESNWIR